MVEVEEIELDLGLSIGGGGTLKKPDPNPIPDSITNVVKVPSGNERSSPTDEKHAKRDIQEEAKKKKRECSRESQEQRESKRERKTENGLSTTVPFHVQFVPFNDKGFAAAALPMWVPPPVLANGCGSEEQINGETENRKGKFNNGSSLCSSVVSDYQSSSHEDGGSTDSHTNSANSLAEPTQLNNSKENYITSQPEKSSSPLPIRSQLGSNSEWINQNVKENQQKPAHGPVKETKVDMGKPPKPMTQTSSSLPQMPYVSTTGKGPNGKTVNGFLYKYSKSEVSIVCVCHGSTFSPAEFVQHAGGTDISHPLRHITVIPYAFC